MTSHCSWHRIASHCCAVDLNVNVNTNGILYPLLISSLLIPSHPIQRRPYEVDMKHVNERERELYIHVITTHLISLFCFHCHPLFAEHLTLPCHCYCSL